MIAKQRKKKVKLQYADRPKNKKGGRAELDFVCRGAIIWQGLTLAQSGCVSPYLQQKFTVEPKTRRRRSETYLSFMPFLKGLEAKKASRP